MQGYRARGFNPHFTRMRSEIIARGQGRSGESRFNPHFTRMRSEITITASGHTRTTFVSILILRGCALKLSWRRCRRRRKRVSILILRGCALKSKIKDPVKFWAMSFNPHFTRMRSEISLMPGMAGTSTGFNPHFTRMRSEIQNILN